MQSTQRNTGETESWSYNFLTRKVKIENGNIETGKTTKTTRGFEIDKLQTLKTFRKPFAWEVEKDIFL